MPAGELAALPEATAAVMGAGAGAVLTRIGTAEGMAGMRTVRMVRMGMRMGTACVREW